MFVVVMNAPSAVARRACGAALFAGHVPSVGADAYVMLLTRERFAGFSRRPVPDPRETTGALFTVAVESREAVDAMVHAAVAAGGAAVHEPEDHGFMYDWSFSDPDGHYWGVFWMSPDAMPA